MSGLSPRQQALRLVAAQTLMAVIIAIGWLFTGWVAFLSALLGGIAAVLPSFYFARRFFATTDARKVERIIRAFYWGEITKILLSAGLAIGFIKMWPKIAILPFFSDFIGAYLGFWLEFPLKRE
jgi:ATP synthase protein I